MIAVAAWIAVAALQWALPASSWCPPPPAPPPEFSQRSSRFFEFEQRSNSWVEIRRPFDLVACSNGSCVKVGSIDAAAGRPPSAALAVRKKVSVARMSDSSVWVTGPSGAIYERFWNGVQWVIAPHELPPAAGAAAATFIVDGSILALSVSGFLYRLQLNDNSQPMWCDVPISNDGGEPYKIRAGVPSSDRRALLLLTAEGLMLEMSALQPLKWESLGRPPGGDVAAVVDTGVIRPGILFTVSSAGDLYEYDRDSKPAWKKHISTESMPLSSVGGAAGVLWGSSSASLFLISKIGRTGF